MVQNLGDGSNSRKQKDGDRFKEVAGKIEGKRLTYEELTQSHLLHMAPE